MRDVHGNLLPDTLRDATHPAGIIWRVAWAQTRDGAVCTLDGFRIWVYSGGASTQPTRNGRPLGRSLQWPNLDVALVELGWERTDET